MAKYHINWKGEAGYCTAQAGNCPFGGAEDHFASAEEARRAYENAQETFGQGAKKSPSEVLASLDVASATPEELDARKAQIREKSFSELSDAEHIEIAAIVSEQERRASAARQAAKPASAGGRFRRGKKLSTRDLHELPPGSVVQWPYHGPNGREMRDWSKQETGTWMLSDGSNGRQVQASYLGGAGGNERATFVSEDGTLTEDLAPMAEKAPRKPPEPKWAIIRKSNVSGKVYLDHEFAREASAKKKFAELNQYDYLHHSYELVTMEEARSLVTA